MVEKKYKKFVCISFFLYFCGKNRKMLFTIITINYNNHIGLFHTIKSVVSQTYRDFEFVVIDGGSSDDSVDVIKDFDNQITYWVSEKDRGIYHAMNKGVAQAHGDYCIFMNSGDCFYDSGVLGRVVNSSATEDIIVGKVSIDEYDHIISPPPLNGLTFYHLYSGAIPHQGAFIKTNLLRKYPYDENLKISSDWKFFVQALIIDNRSIRYLDIFVSRYDMNGVSSSNPELMRKEKDEILNKLFPIRVLEDYRRFKLSECLTQTLTPQLKVNYGIDRILFCLGKILLKIGGIFHR